MRMLRSTLPVIAGLMVLDGMMTCATAQGWNPFPDRDPPSWSNPAGSFAAAEPTGTHSSGPSVRRAKR